MKLFYGSYGPLADSFLEFVSAVRKNPLEKWLVICASSLLAKELQKRLAEQLGVLANIHFITLSGLTTRLDAENGKNTLPLFPQNHLRNFLIKELLHQPGLDRYPISEGFVEAVKSSLRDLADSLVSADVWDEYIATLPEEILKEEGDKLTWLARLYRKYTEQEKHIPGFRSYQNVFEQAFEQVEHSAFLGSFKQIIVYGFYDMSGRQLDLIKRICSFYPVTVFAPYKKHNAFRFAEKFFKTNWLVTPDVQKAESSSKTDLHKSMECLFVSSESVACEQVRIVSTADKEGELFFVAKEILRLTQEENYTFADIGLIARTCAPFQGEIRRIFAANKIPLDASFTYTLSHYPLGIFCLNLFSLPQRGFDRETVLKILSSPYFRYPRKRAWSAIVRRSLVSRDFQQWKDLLPQTKDYDPALLTWLEMVSSRLEELNAVQSWTDAVSKAIALLKETIDESAFLGKDKEIFEAVCKTLEQLGLYQTIRPHTQSGEFLRELSNALEKISFNESENIPGGVLFTDAIRARGLQFKIVFILGLNDQSFPLVTPEDPILRDYYRYMLRDVLGYWINKSLDRDDEEKLLFFTAATAAKEKLYALYDRTNQEGKPAIASVYVAELARAAKLKLPDAVQHISGRIQEQLLHIPSKWFTPKEMSVFIALNAENILASYKEAGLLTPEKETVLAAAQALAEKGNLNAFDGIIQSGREIFESANKKGFSPSALKNIAACPLKYFFDKGLHLEEPDDLLRRDQLSKDKQGTIYHNILCRFYSYLYEHHLTDSLFDSGAVKYIEQIVENECPKDGYRVFGIYPLMWELTIENIRQQLTDFVTEDLKELGTFIPSRFEKEVSLEPTEKMPFRLNGRIDRIDLDDTNHTFRIVDYKSSKKDHETKNLVSDLFRYLTFQPFLYLFIALYLEDLKKYTPAESVLLAIKPKYNKRTLTHEQFETISTQACTFFNYLTDLIKNGTFFIYQSDKKTDNICKYCPYSSICRKDSFNTLLRARKSALSKKHKEERK